MFLISSVLSVVVFVELVRGVAKAPNVFDAGGTGPLTHEELLKFPLEALQSEDLWRHVGVLEPLHIPFNKTRPKGIYEKLSLGVPRTMAAVLNRGYKTPSGGGGSIDFGAVALRHRECTNVAKDQTLRITNHPKSVPKTNIVDAETVINALNKSSNAYAIILRDLESHTSKVCRRVCEDLSQRYGSMFCYANWYVSPVSSCAHFPHLDLEDNFVVQLSGAKRWEFYNTTRMAPSLDLCQEDDCEKVRHKDWGWPPIGDGLLKKITMLPGDLLYFPRGLIHEARADYKDLKQYGQYSSHVTFALTTGLNWADLLTQLLEARVQEDSALAKDLYSLACSNSAVQSHMTVEVGADASVLEQKSVACPKILVQEKLSWKWFASNLIQAAAGMNVDLRRIVIKRKESASQFSSNLQRAVDALGEVLLHNETSNDKPKAAPQTMQHLIVQVLAYGNSQDDNSLSKDFSKLFGSPKQLSKKLQLRKASCADDNSDSAWLSSYTCSSLKEFGWCDPSADYYSDIKKRCPNSCGICDRQGTWLDSMQAKIRSKLDAVFMGTLTGENKVKRKAFAAKAAAAMKIAQKKVDEARNDHFAGLKSKFSV